EMCLPDPRDVFAHLIGHFVKSRTRLDDATRIADLVLMVERCGLDPADCAQHLHAAGMARAARYVLQDLSERGPGTFCRTLLQPLPEEPLGERIVRFARATSAAPFARPALMTLSGFALDTSLPAGARALALRAWDYRYDWSPASRGRERL